MQMYILYHGGGCVDGFGAAWVAHHGLGGLAKYIPVQYGEPMPPIEDGSSVHILDFSYKMDELRSLAWRSEWVAVRDHHATAERELSPLIGMLPNLDIVFDMGKSGAVLAWEYFFPDRKPMEMIKYIEDRDLWKWSMEKSREYSAALSVEPKDFARWEQIALFTQWKSRPEESRKFDDFISRGRAILDAKESYVAGLATHAGFQFVGGHRVPVINSPLFQSEIGERLCELFPEADFGAVFFVEKAGDEIWSLRSRNGFDVSAVAKSMGGGGHAAAAGFKRKRDGR